MKLRIFKKFCALFLACAVIFSLSASPAIREFSDFTLLGSFELYSKPVMSEKKFVFRTINHEGGLKLRMLEAGVKEQGGQWYYVLLNNGQWDENGQWFKPNSKFWIFLTDAEPIYDCSDGF